MARRLPPLSITPDTNTDIPNQWKISWQRDFTGGENKLILPELMGPNQLIDAQNCELSADGLPQTRKGKFRLNSSEIGTTGFTSFHRYTRENGTRSLLVQQGTKLYAIVWDGDDAITSLGTEIKTLTSTNKLEYVTWKDRVFVTNGVDNLFTVYYNGTSFIVADVAGSPPICKHPVVYANRLFVVPVAYPNAIKFCNLEDYTTWDVLDIIKIRDADGDTIQALSPQGEGLIVAKTKSIWAVYGTNIDNFSIPSSPIFAEDGCASPDCFLPVGIFMGYAGLYTYNLSSVTPVFATHRSVIQSLTTAQKASSYGIVDPINKRILLNLGTGDTLCIQEQTSPSTTETYYSCTTWTNLNAGCMTVANDANDPCSLIIGDATHGYLYLLINDTDDDGTPISTKIKTAYSDKQTLTDKIWRRFVPEIEVLSGAGSYNVTLKYDVDFESTSGQTQLSGSTSTFIWNTSLWGDSWGASVRTDVPFYFEARGRRISFELSSDSRIKLLGYNEKYREAVTQ